MHLTRDSTAGHWLTITEWLKWWTKFRVPDLNRFSDEYLYRYFLVCGPGQVDKMPGSCALYKTFGFCTAALLTPFMTTSCPVTCRFCGKANWLTNFRMNINISENWAWFCNGAKLRRNDLKVDGHILDRFLLLFVAVRTLAMERVPEMYFMKVSCTQEIFIKFFWKKKY